MKNKLFVYVALLFFWGCHARLETQMKSLEGSSPEFQSYIKKQYAEGEQLFKKYCAPCHGIFGAGNSDAPNFSAIELHNYNAAFIRGDRENHAVARGIDDESFEKIMTFLTYRQQDTIR